MDLCRRPASAALATGAILAVVVAAMPAQAQSVIRQPGVHPDYVFEAEPHILFALDPPGHGGGDGIGPGFRGTIEIVDNGFISKINNTVGIGFGADYIALAR